MAGLLVAIMTSVPVAHSEAVRVDRARHTRHGSRGPSFSVGKWLHKGMGIDWSPRYRRSVSEPRRGRGPTRAGGDDGAAQDQATIWELVSMYSTSNSAIFGSSGGTGADDDDGGFLTMDERREPTVIWATPSPLTASGVHPLVAHIPKTSSETKDDPQGRLAYADRVRTIAKSMGYEWTGPISEHILTEHHVMHALLGDELSTPTGSTQSPPPPHPATVGDMLGLDHGLLPRANDDDNDGGSIPTNGDTKPTSAALRQWSDAWRKWAHNVTDPYPPPTQQAPTPTVGDRSERADSAGGSHLSPWQIRLHWARELRQRWTNHPEVERVMLQRPHMRTHRGTDSGFPPFPDPKQDPNMKPAHKGTPEVSTQRPLATLPRSPTLWMSYRESPSIQPRDERPAVSLREEMHERARRRTKDWRSVTPGVADPLLTAEWNLYDAQAWGDLPPGPAIHRPSISGGPACWDLLGYNGSGVAIGVVDSGVEVTHPELKDRYLRALSMDALNAHRTGDPTPVSPRLETHGTQAAGVAVATRGNGICGAGVAPGASMGVMRLLGLRSPTDLEEARALAYACRRNPNHSDHTPSHISIYTNSWGPTDDGSGLHGPGPLTAAAIDACVHHVGRGGLGSIYVWAGGNGRTHGDNVNFDGYANRPETIAVAAIDDTSRQAWYSESGACLLVSVPSSGATLGIITSDPSGRWGLSSGICTDSFGGTSAAAPAAAGVIALMLQANPQLGWRDVQHIFVRSAQPLRMWDHRQPWAQNGAGYWHSHGLGFGLLNATRAVSMARHWTKVPAPAVVSQGEYLTAASTWRLDHDSPQRRYMERLTLTEEQKEVQRLFHQDTEAERKAAEHAERVNERRARRLSKGGPLWRALHWTGQRVIGGAHSVWAGAISQVLERSALEAKARREAWTSRDPFVVRVVNDRHGAPVGVAIPPGMGANFTWTDGWFMPANGQNPTRKPAIAHLEHVGLQIYVNTPGGRGRLRIRLFSPAGTESVFAEGTAVNDQHMGIDGHRWTFWTVRCWGEPTGIPGTGADTAAEQITRMWRLEVWHMEAGQSQPERDAKMRRSGIPRPPTEEARNVWRTRIHQPERVDAVVRWWRLVGRGTQT